MYSTQRGRSLFSIRGANDSLAGSGLSNGDQHQHGRFACMPSMQPYAQHIIKVESGGGIAHIGTRGHSGIPMVSMQHVGNPG